MKTKHLIISALVVLGTISACKKEKTTPVTPEATNPNLSKNGCVLTETYGEQFNKPSFLRSLRIDRSTAQNRNQKTTAQVLNEKYFYDAQGRVTKLEVYETDSTGTAFLYYEQTLTYSPGSLTVISIDYDEPGEPDEKDTINATTNGFGFVTSVSDKSPDGDEYSSTFEYNEDGYLTKENSKYTYTYNSGGTPVKVIVTDVYSYEYTNGNLVKETATSSQTENGQTTSTSSSSATYTYGSQVMQPNFISDYPPFLGKLNKNLPTASSQTYLYDNQPPATYSYTYSYELDTKGNVTKQTTTNVDFPEPDVNTYTYQCK